MSSGLYVSVSKYKRLGMLTIVKFVAGRGFEPLIPSKTQHTNLHKVVVPRVLAEVLFCRRSTGETFSVSQLLEVVQPAGDAPVAVGVKGIQVDAGSAVHAAVHFRAGENRIQVCVHNAGCRGCIGVDDEDFLN